MVFIYHLRLKKAIILILFCLLALIFFSSCNNSFKSIRDSWSRSRLMVVLSGSMRPSVREGDLIVVVSEKGSLYELGDIISYRERGADRIITHRVTAALKGEKGYSYITKGDANQWPDRNLVPAEKVVGKVQLRIPYLGHVVEFAKSNHGLIFIMVFPGIFLFFKECRDIARELNGKNE